MDRILSVEEAIDITIEHASDFEEQILSLAQRNTIKSYGNTLTQIFFPISKTYYEPLKAALKSYGTHKKSWLRIYAIQIQDVLIITGGAIKLTKTMQEREHTQQELNNLMKVANGLKRNLLKENTDFDFISFEI